jgi:ZIP family zinc transporter
MVSIGDRQRAKGAAVSLVEEALLLGAIGFAAGLAGAATAATRAPSGAVTSYVQHFAAGLIIAAAALELLPEARHIGGDWALIVGFGVGMIFMVGLRSTTEWLGHAGHGGHGAQRDAHETSSANLPLIAALAVVVLIDGSIIGIALSTGESGSTLIAVALAAELIFVSASVSGSLIASGSARSIATAGGGFVAFMLPIGAVIGALIFDGASSTLLVAALGFASVVLLFTAIEELLLEAHEHKESAGTSITLFLAFLLFLTMVLLTD